MSLAAGAAIELAYVGSQTRVEAVAPSERFEAAYNGLKDEHEYCTVYVYLVILIQSRHLRSKAEAPKSIAPTQPRTKASDSASMRMPLPVPVRPASSLCPASSAQ